MVYQLSEWLFMRWNFASIVTVRGDVAPREQHPHVLGSLSPQQDGSAMSAGGVPRVANEAFHVLGEGPTWDAARGRLLWVDIRRGLVLVGRLDPDGLIEILERVGFDGTVGAVATAKDGSWIVAGSERLLIRTVEGEVLPGPRLVPGDSGRRLNDGKPDPAGRFAVGSLNLTDDGLADQFLAVVDPDGSVRVLDDDLTLSNGLAWSIDGTRLYSVDTLRQTVYVRAYDVRTGSPGPRSAFVTMKNGFPDGMCMDADEHLWIAMWGLGQVHRYSPAGELVRIIEVPAPNTSSVAFAGERLNTLVITTATQDLSDDQLTRFPDSGRLFTVVPGVLGAPQAPWAGVVRDTATPSGRTP